MTFNLINWASGKKTYATVAIALALGVYQGVTGHDVPQYVYWGLGFAGLGFHRMGMQKDATAATVAVQALFEDLKSQLTTPVEGQPTGPVGAVNEPAVTANLNRASLDATKAEAAK